MRSIASEKSRAPDAVSISPSGLARRGIGWRFKAFCPRPEVRVCRGCPCKGLGVSVATRCVAHPLGVNCLHRVALLGFDPVIGRRAFLRVTGLGAGLLAVSQLRLAAPSRALAESVAPNALRVLTPGDARILAAVAERMVFTGEADMPRFRDTDGLRTIDTALLQLSPDVRRQLHWGLLLFQYAPPFFLAGLSTYTDLSESAQDAYLRQWEQSRFQTLRLAFQAFKNLAMLGYYSQDATWKGIHYHGPWVPRPRRVIGGSVTSGQ
jgi:hypothetical protein